MIQSRSKPPAPLGESESRRPDESSGLGESRHRAALSGVGESRDRKGRSVLFFELNEAEKHFLEAFVAQGKLPNFARMLDGGALMRTKVPGWNAGDSKAWRAISPWIIWPSVYTGMQPHDHGIVGFGQDTRSIQGKCVWDVLDANGISTGILGSLMSYPPRTSGAGAYYVPESLADTADCFPEDARALQEFCVFSARNYSESFSGARTATAVKLLLRTRKSGVRTGTLWKTLRQMPAEMLHGASAVPERAMLHSYLTRDAFWTLYERTRPSYASVHMNHVAYMQHRYWRAAEPERFRADLSATDQRFFKSVAERQTYEEKFSKWIERSFVYSDAFLGEVLERVDDRTVVLVGTALGQRPFDPVTDIHNPVVRLVNAEELFDSIGMKNYAVLHQMNPDLTVNMPDEETARFTERAIAGLWVQEEEPLFTVQRRGAQVFCELNMPQRSKPDERFVIRHRERPEFRADFARHISEHPTNDQSTAHHKDSGWLLAWCKGGRITEAEQVIRVTDIAPTILSLYGIPPQPWMAPDSCIAFKVGA